MSSSVGLLTVLTSFLRNRNCRIRGTSDNRRTLTRLHASAPSLVILSVVVPKVNKVKILSELVLPSKAFHCPVLILATGTTVSRCFTSGRVSNFLTGPYSPRSLTLRINHVVFRSTTRGGPITRRGPLVCLTSKRRSHHVALTNTLRQSNCDMVRYTDNTSLVRTAILIPPMVVMVTLRLNSRDTNSMMALVESVASATHMGIIICKLKLPNTGLSSMLTMSSHTYRTVSNSDRLSMLATISNRVLEI